MYFTKYKTVLVNIILDAVLIIVLTTRTLASNCLALLIISRGKKISRMILNSLKLKIAKIMTNQNEKKHLIIK